MSQTLRRSWTQEQFFAWAEAQDERHESDGLHPVAMTGETLRHSAIMRNLHRALDARLRDGPCQWLGPDAGLATTGTAVRYPKPWSRARSSTSVRGRARCRCCLRGDHFRHQPDGPYPQGLGYAAVPSIRRYVMLETTAGGLMVLERERPDEAWRTAALTDEEILRMPEISIEIPVRVLYADITFPQEGGATA